VPAETKDPDVTDMVTPMAGGLTQVFLSIAQTSQESSAGWS